MYGEDDQDHLGTALRHFLPGIRVDHVDKPGDDDAENWTRPGMVTHRRNTRACVPR